MVAYFGRAAYQVALDAMKKSSGRPLTVGHARPTVSSMSNTIAFPLPAEAKAAAKAFGLIREADQRDVIMTESDDAILASMLLDVVQGLTEAAAILTPLARAAASRATRKARQVLVPEGTAATAPRPEPPEPKRYARRSRPKRAAKEGVMVPAEIRTNAPRCCDTPTPGVHDGQRYCESCDTDLCAFCDSPAVAGYSDRGPRCARCWTEGALST